MDNFEIDYNKESLELLVYPVILPVDTSNDKYPFTLTQLDTIKDANRTLCFDVQDIVKEWRITEMMCECMDLVKELEEMKRYGHASK